MTTGEVMFDADRFRDEVRHDPFVFKWAGRTWEMRHYRDVDDSVLELIELSQDDFSLKHLRTVLTALLGEQQWRELTETQRLPFKVLEELLNRWLRHCGLDQGESVSSADSSTGTAELSKRTSDGSTASSSAGHSTAPRKNASRRGRS